MQLRTQFDEARRWTKFPATVLLITGVLWLVVVIFRVAQDGGAALASEARTVVGIVWLLLRIPVTLIGCPLAALGVYYLQRQAFYAAAALPALPLLSVSLDKAARIGAHF